jgi:hypothetical protein
MVSKIEVSSSSVSETDDQARRGHISLYLVQHGYGLPIYLEEASRRLDLSLMDVLAGDQVREPVQHACNRLSTILDMLANERLADNLHRTVAYGKLFELGMETVAELKKRCVEADEMEEVLSKDDPDLFDACRSGPKPYVGWESSALAHNETFFKVADQLRDEVEAVKPGPYAEELIELLQHLDLFLRHDPMKEEGYRRVIHQYAVQRALALYDGCARLNLA